MKNILSIIFISLLIGCSSDEHPSYKPIQNNIPLGGPLINYDPNTSLTNITEVENYLNEKNEDIFNKSLSWYGTESEFGFEYIHNKNAKQLVDIVNCLKVNSQKNQEQCFN